MRYTALQPWLTIIAMLCLLGLQGCSSLPATPTAEPLIYTSTDKDSLLGQYAPLIAPQESSQRYNRIGSAAARLDDKGKEEIYIDTNHPSFYGQQRDFTSNSGQHYTNLIYRFHFPFVPQPHLTAGKNGGLFVIITLDQQQQPVLVTTVHSCGCYLAIVPTSYLPPAAYPDNWNTQSQSVYGETLPGLLHYPNEFDTSWRPLIQLRSGNHRVMAIRLAQPAPENTAVEILPLEALQRLPLGDGHTSFFHESGRLKGYVKGAFKPWELLLMSWWSLDLNVGRDKRLGDPTDTGTVFYTSLKPWARQASNMWNFADFLEYWGWRL